MSYNSGQAAGALAVRFVGFMPGGSPAGRRSARLGPLTQTAFKGGLMRILIHYLIAVVILTIYGGQV